MTFARYIQTRFIYFTSLCLFLARSRSCKCQRVLKLFSIISVKAKSFADREIRYTLKAQGQGAAGTFNIGPTSGIVKLAKELDFEDLRQPHIYSLIVTATEDSGGFSTSVEASGFTFLSSFVIITTEVTHSFPSAKNTHTYLLVFFFLELSVKQCISLILIILFLLLI